MKWKYDIREFTINDYFKRSDVIKELNSMGKNEWEVVSVEHKINEEENYIVWFKKPTTTTDDYYDSDSLY